jgi:hypothetical protein
LPTRQGVTQKLDQVVPCVELSSATENSGPRRQESRRSLVTLEQVARVCKVAGLAGSGGRGGRAAGPSRGSGLRLRTDGTRPRTWRGQRPPVCRAGPPT